MMTRFNSKENCFKHTSTQADLKIKHVLARHLKQGLSFSYCAALVFIFLISSEI